MNGSAPRDKHDLARTLGESLRADVDALNLDNFHTANLFGLWVAPGFNDPEHYAAYLLQGGVEMPDREYYLSDSETMRDIRAKYQTHVSAMLKLAGFTDPDVRAQHIIELEHAIAEKHIPLADQGGAFASERSPPSLSCLMPCIHSLSPQKDGSRRLSLILKAGISSLIDE